MLMSGSFIGCNEVPLIYYLTSFLLLLLIPFIILHNTKLIAHQLGGNCLHKTMLRVAPCSLLLAKAVRKLVTKKYLGWAMVLHDLDDHHGDGMQLLEPLMSFFIADKYINLLLLNLTRNINDETIQTKREIN